MNVSTNDIRNIVGVLCDHLDNTGRSAVAVEEDYYWNIEDSDVYDMTKDPASFDIGQISSDWQSLKDVLDDRDAAIGYGFVWLASVLRAIGKENVS